MHIDNNVISIPDLVCETLNQEFRHFVLGDNEIVSGGEGKHLHFASQVDADRGTEVVLLSLRDDLQNLWVLRSKLELHEQLLLLNEMYPWVSVDDHLVKHSLNSDSILEPDTIHSSQGL